MKRLLQAWLSVVIISVLVGCLHQTSSDVPDVEGSIARVYTEFRSHNRGGTAFLVSHGRRFYMVTAAHVLIDDSFCLPSRAVFIFGDKRIDFEDFCFSNLYDVAVTEITNTDGLKPLPIETSLPDEGEECYLFGFPRGKFLRTHGPSGETYFAPYIHLTVRARVFSGMSGGPVISNGKVVGVIRGQGLRKSLHTPSNAILGLIQEWETRHPHDDSGVAVIHPEIR